MKSRTLPAAAALALAAAVAAALPNRAVAQDNAATMTTTPATPAKADGQAAVPVKAVVLFSSGVGYFEHFGTVAGQGSTELRFKTEQINDLLKSLVLQDLDGGSVSAITYPSLDPLDKTLKSFQVDITGNPTLADLLNQLRGANITVQQFDQKTSGTILGVEKKQRPVKKTGDGDPQVVEVSVLNLITDKGIIAVQLDDVGAIELEDDQLQQELNKALTALAQARDQDKKPVQIRFAGEGDRRVRLGYVVETPVWKTSYRLILPQGGADAETKPALQGWAIIENQTDNDWNDVQLSLVSGRPISFVMDLYQPLYIPRPVVQQELYASLRPQVYAGAMGGEMETRAFEMEASQAGRGAKAAPPASPAPAARARLERRGGSGGGQSVFSGSFGVAADAAEPMDASASVQSLASAAQVGELFQYTVGNVSLPRQKSAMIPIITDPVEVEKLSIYNANVLAKHPLNGARVKNTTGKHLLQGPITVLESGSYAGDAQIDNLPPGQERLLSYGVDLQVVMDSSSRKDESALLTGKIVKGVLHLTRKHVASQDYVAENKGDKPKAMIIEHPRRQNWKLVEPEKPLETTDALYRFKGSAEPGKKTKLTVREEIVQGEMLAILPTDLGQLVYYSRAGEIPADVRDALAKAITQKQALAETERAIAEKKKQLEEISQEQNRIRENLKTVQQNSAYYNRLMTKLNDQETKIEGLQTEIDQLTEQMNNQRKELEAYVSNLSVG